MGNTRERELIVGYVNGILWLVAPLLAPNILHKENNDQPVDFRVPLFSDKLITSGSMLAESGSKSGQPTTEKASERDIL